MNANSIERYGDMHQAGSDAFGTVMVYVKAGRGKTDGFNKIYDLDD